MKQLTLIGLLLILVVVSCSKQGPVGPPEKEFVFIKESAVPLSYSQTWLRTNDNGYIIWVRVHNDSYNDWYGYQMVHTLNESGSVLSKTRGVLTNRVDYTSMVALDTTDYIPRQGSVECIATVTVDWSKHNSVFIKWFFVSTDSAMGKTTTLNLMNKQKEID